MNFLIDKLYQNLFNVYFGNSLLNIKSNYEFQEKVEINKFILTSNLMRDYLIALILFVTNIILLMVDIFYNREFFSTNGNFISLFYSRIAYLIFMTFFLSLYTILKEKIHSKYITEKIFHYSFLTITLIWILFLSINAQFLHGQISSLIICLFTLAFFTTLNKYERVIFLLLPTLIFNVHLFYFLDKSSVLTGNMMNSIFLCFLCFLISAFQETFYKKHLIQSITLSSSNQELLHVKETLEQEIDRRSEELTNAHNLLLNEILDNHNYELKILKSKIDLEKNEEKLKQVEAYEQLRAEFFANISHELKTPLNVIFSAQQILEKNINQTLNTTTKDKKYLKIIKQNCFRLIRLIGNLIDLTKIDSGYLNVTLSNNDIVRITEDITLSVATFIEDKNIELIFDTDIEEKEIACDPENIERIILNLLSNAVKFTPEYGKIFVTIKDNHDTISIKVKDTGIGIPLDIQDKIFDRFIQADKSINRNREGSGIGLSLVKSLVELHNGTITLKSSPNEGTEFDISLPCTIAPKSDICENITPQEYSYNEHIEKIFIEFSDIYFN
ncbi:HAMP domain-containing histidine kinase [Oceanirhabdus seepicola]|uniref:histidine kinase n=2 Tax=Oceanirhabdus seepicola TaxID=2828781 RepID=A0A9J6NY40_9CLOT|nr:HAMP domain-containing histidine kinase [Oceanirhabdus seepicola]